MVLQRDSFLVVFSLPFSGKDKENRSRAAMGEKPHRAQALKTTTVSCLSSESWFL